MKGVSKRVAGLIDGAVKRGTLLSCSVTAILDVHKVRLRFSFGRALHCTPFDNANVKLKESINPAGVPLGLNYICVRPTD